MKRPWRAHACRVGNIAIFMLVGAIAACSNETPPERASLASVSQRLSTYSITLPKGTSLGEYAIVANGALAVEDRAKIVDPDGAPVGVANAGVVLSRVGVSAELGPVLSVGGIDVRDNAIVHGDLTTEGPIQLGNAVTVHGEQRPNTEGLSPGDQEFISIDFDAASQGDVWLEPPNGASERVTTLSPGRYGQVVIKSRNRVNLSSGEYIFNALVLEPQARLVVDDGAGPVLISVRDQLLYKGAIESESGQHPALRLAYVGTQAVVLESAFRGTLLAPSASIRLATLQPNQRHVGSFLAKDVTVSPDVVVEFRPYFVYRATLDFEVPSSTYGNFGYATVTPDGTINARVHDNVIKITPQGAHQKLLSEDIEVQYLVDRETGAFGYYGDGTFERYRPDGTKLGSYPRTRIAKAWFVPGTEKTAILVSNDRDHEPKWSGIRVVGPSTSVDIAAPGLENFAVSPSLLVYSTRTELVALSHSGSEVFRIPLPLRQLAIASGGSTLIGVRAERGTSKVVHVDLSNAAVTESATLDRAIWSLAVAPGGAYSIAATKTRLYLFKNGVLEREMGLPMATFASADVNDKGEVIVGGATAANNTVLMVAGPAGTKAWVDSTGAEDDIALRPYVRFEKGKVDFIAVRKEGLSRFTVRRGL